MTAATVQLAVADRVAQITVDRPNKRNAMTLHMWTQLREHLVTVEQSDSVSAVVIFGAGGSFSAGRDLAEVQQSITGGIDEGPAVAQQVLTAIDKLHKTTIAAIDGPCFGAGCSLALACDIRIASPRSIFGLPVLANGLTYADHLVRRLVQVVGSGPAGLLLLGGERWNAADAAAHGLIDKRAEDVLTEAHRLLAGVRAVENIISGPLVRSLKLASETGSRCAML